MATMSLIRATALAILLPLAASSVWAERPLQTENTDVQDRGRCEFEVIVERVTAAGASATSRGADLGCGIGWNSQVSVGVARLRAASGDTDAAGLSGKTQLWRASSDAGRALLLAWGLSAQRDAQAAAGTGGWKTTEQAVTLVGSQTLGPGQLLVNLGHVRERDPRASVTAWNLGYAHDGLAVGSMTLAPVAEIFGDDRGDRWWNLGLRADLIAEKLSVDLSAGRQTTSDRARLLTLGIKLGF
jgi:hypothetical protein